jgi:hypothetical protein
MKQVRLTDLLSQALGHDVLERSSLYDSGRKSPLEEQRAAALLSGVGGALTKFKSTRKHNIVSWPGIWVKIERESKEEMKAAEPELEDEDLNFMFEVHFPHKDAWMRLDFWRDGDLFCLQVYPTHASFALDTASGKFLWSGSASGADKKALVEAMKWLADAASKELLLCASNPARYAEDLNRALPCRERFGRIKRADLWEVIPEDEQVFIRDELSEVQKSKFLEIAPSLKQVAPVLDMTLDRYLESCAICYRAIGLDTAGRSDRELYEMMADGRHENLLKVKSGSPQALKSWLLRRPGGGHPFEIVRGGNETHIDLFLVNENEGIKLVLKGSSTGRAAETIKMALALHDAGVSFELSDAVLHTERIQGNDWIGIVPDYYAGCSSFGLFPEVDRIRDLAIYSSACEREEAVSRVRWYPLEILQPRTGE